MNSWIAGSLDYRQLAEQHRPTKAEALATEVRRLAGNGLTARDIAMALRLDLGQVLEMLRKEAA